MNLDKKNIKFQERGNISILKLTERFCVAPSFIKKILKPYKEVENIHPRPQGGSPKPKLNGEQLIDLIAISETHNDATLVELCNLLEEKAQVRVSRATMGRLTQKLN